MRSRQQNQESSLLYSKSPQMKEQILVFRHYNPLNDVFHGSRRDVFLSTISWALINAFSISTRSLLQGGSLSIYGNASLSLFSTWSACH